ncbi:MAG TPA: PIG-L family deacetylase [Planctomycetaceae bacterium]|nr:PIG-L family deacetylase [Planctomycetaceae bacterium]
MQSSFSTIVDIRARLWCAAWTAVALLLVASAQSKAESPSAGAVILEKLRAFQEMGSVLHVAAHPDDENTQLITYLARGRRVRAAYLSITRGDGGQNVLGGEFGPQLGLIRTHELLAARRLDGGKQFFTRAIDFGFSKDPEETLKIWDEQAVLSDVVRVIRTFRPDVIVTRFSPQASRTHGHHTASAILALEAFKVSGDPHAFPDQHKGLEPWQPKRILMNRGFGGGGGGEGAVQLDVGGTDVLLDESFSTIASHSRAMHKSQGFGNFGSGGRGGGRSRTESFQLLAGEPAKKDIFDGIDVQWTRVRGGAEIGKLVRDVIAKFKPGDPGASVSDLLVLRRKLTALADEPLVREKRRDFDQILQACLGLDVKSTVNKAEVSPGDSVTIESSVTRNGNIPVSWLGVRYPTLNKEVKRTSKLPLNQVVNATDQEVLPNDMPVSQPYWLRDVPGVGIYRVVEPNLIGQPLGPPPLLVEHEFEVEGQAFVVPIVPTARVVENGKRIDRSLDVVPPVFLGFPFEVARFSPGQKRSVPITVSSGGHSVTGEITLSAPAGWKVAPRSQMFQIATGAQSKYSFDVTPPAHPALASIIAHATVNGRTYDNGRVDINYAHIGHLLLQPTARLTAVSFDLNIRGRTVGYVEGAGDSVAECLTQMGYTVKPLSATDLTKEGLHGLDAVVIGVRAFNVRKDLGKHMPALFAFAESGGNLIVQYNRPEGLKSDRFAPYDLGLSGQRVTDEHSPVTFLLPDHPALNTPNKITQADFDGWVQERGIYFPNEWDQHFKAPLAFKDPNEPPLEGGILIAPHGRGNVIYTSLVWFRELPAGVPGAYRLFANLVSLGKS